LFKMRKHRQRKMLTTRQMNLISNLQQMQCRLGQKNKNILHWL
jgi:hypothetical protein